MTPFNARVVACLPVFLALVIAPLASAQTQSAVSGFVTGNIGMARPAADTLTSIASSSDGGDRAEARLTGAMTSSPAVDFGGGVIIRNRWVLGASFDRTAESSPSDVVVTLQHPDFHPTLTATKATEPLERVDHGIHLSAGINIPIKSAFSLRVFGGPSYLTREQDILSDISVTETQSLVTRAWSATIDSFELRRVRSTAWGYHVGADGSYFLSRHVGIGGQLRYSRATFETENILQSEVDERPVHDLVKGGGLSMTAGVRVRF